jgi:hypothetical protein
VNRRELFGPGRRVGVAAAARTASAFVPAHRWDGYDWGTAPPVADRLNQCPFPQYPPEEVLPGSEVVMATTPSHEVVPGYGMGLVAYVTGDFGGETFQGVEMEKHVEDMARLPMGQKLYVRPTWRQLQRRPGRLDPEPYWKATFDAHANSRRVGFRVMMSSPDTRRRCRTSSAKVPMVR